MGSLIALLVLLGAFGFAFIILYEMIYDSIDPYYHNGSYRIVTVETRGGDLDYYIQMKRKYSFIWRYVHCREYSKTVNLYLLFRSQVPRQSDKDKTIRIATRIKQRNEKLYGAKKIRSVHKEII